FQAALKPYLANKKDKPFLDRWLLEEDLSQYLEPWWYGRLNTVERVLLAQRIRGEPAKTARDVTDRLRLLPPNIDRFLSLFDTAVKGGALATEDALGLGKVTRDLQQGRTPVLPPMSQPLMGGMGGGGAGFKVPQTGARAPQKDAETRFGMDLKEDNAD